MSRNRDRLGNNSTPQDSSLPTAAVQNEPSEGFSFVVPTEFVDLPSQGKFYADGHPLAGQNTIEIKQMTAKEEDILTSRTLLKNGVAVDRVIKSLIVNKGINPDSLLVGDRNAVLIAARISAYGNTYSTSVSCPSCGTTQDYSFDLYDTNITHGGEDDENILDITDNGDGTFATVLPKTQLNVTFRLLDGVDEKRIYNASEQARKRNKVEQTVTNQIKTMVVSVNDDNSPQAINYLIENMPSLDTRHLRACYRSVAPNIDLTQFFSCDECGHSQDMEVPLTADFFWPNL
ncbi:MAG TPA: hypothetical protein DCE52_16380 [Rhodobacteraceae bacterium]|nr:hypothetical protein [Paracoccaceae bacterium]